MNLKYLDEHLRIIYLNESFFEAAKTVFFKIFRNRQIDKKELFDNVDLPPEETYIQHAKKKLKSYDEVEKIVNKHAGNMSTLEKGCITAIMASVKELQEYPSIRKEMQEIFSELYAILKNATISAAEVSIVTGFIHVLLRYFANRKFLSRFTLRIIKISIPATFIFLGLAILARLGYAFTKKEKEK